MEQVMATGFKKRLKDLILNRAYNVNCKDSSLSKLGIEIDKMTNITNMIDYIYDNSPELIAWAYADIGTLKIHLSGDDIMSFTDRIIFKDKRKNAAERLITHNAKIYRKYQGA